MSKQSLSKENLLSYAKNINPNFSSYFFDYFKKKSESIQKDKNKSFSNESPLTSSKYLSRIKSKYLEKENIQINKEKIRNILDEKRKQRLTQSQRVNKTRKLFDLKSTNETEIKNKNISLFTERKKLDEGVPKNQSPLLSNNLDKYRNFKLINVNLTDKNKNYEKLINRFFLANKGQEICRTEANEDVNEKNEIKNNININININEMNNDNNSSRYSINNKRNLFLSKEKYITVNKNLNENKNKAYVPSTERIKKYISYRNYLNGKSITKVEDKEENMIKKNNGKNDCNIYNINLNFISDKRNNVELYNNVRLINYKDNNNQNKVTTRIYSNLIRREKIQREINSSNFNNFPLSINNIIKNQNEIIKLEDLIILEQKLYSILTSIKSDYLIPKMFTGWWSFYIYSSFFGKFTKLFPQPKSTGISEYSIAHSSVILEVLSIIIAYELSNNQTNKSINSILGKIFTEVHQNLLLKCDYILSKKKSNDNNGINLLKSIIKRKKKWKFRNIFHISIIKEGNTQIQNYIEELLDQKKIPFDINIPSLLNFNRNLSKVDINQLIKYFNNRVNIQNLKMGRIFSNVINFCSNRISRKIDKNNDNNSYLPKKFDNSKEYTLVLDLDETLVSYRLNSNFEEVLKLRPGLFHFLQNVGEKYELVLFTAGTQEYADHILDNIENKKKIFIRRLYRHHCVHMDKIYIKDLTKLGRSLSKIIIVDNMPQNFCLQKENGIFIKDYYGQDDDEQTLFDLEKILLNIASKPNNDVREELQKYKEEIFSKITTNP